MVASPFSYPQRVEAESGEQASYKNLPNFIMDGSAFIKIEPNYIAITVVKSQYQLAEEEAKPKPIVKKTPSLTVNNDRSGDEYGTAVKLYPDRTNNCVSFAKAQTGITGTLGTGARAAIQGKEPQVGAIGSLKGRAHAAVVTRVIDDQVTIKESNYIKGWITQRTLPASMFLGFIYH